MSFLCQKRCLNIFHCKTMCSSHNNFRGILYTFYLERIISMCMCVHTRKQVCVSLCVHVCVFEHTSRLIFKYEAGLILEFWGSGVLATMQSDKSAPKMVYWQMHDKLPTSKASKEELTSYYLKFEVNQKCGCWVVVFKVKLHVMCHAPIGTVTVLQVWQKKMGSWFLKGIVWICCLTVPL